MAGVLAPHVTPGQAMKLRINERHELLERSLVAITPSYE
jgi:hypothetical protein